MFGTTYFNSIVFYLISFFEFYLVREILVSYTPQAPCVLFFLIIP
jgi:hypothetical protein